MRIFRNELKKLLNWKLLLLLAVFTGLFYYMFLNFNLIDCYPNGHPATESLEIGKRMLGKYGPIIDAEEQKEFETVDYPAIKQEANRELAGIKEFREARITTVDELDALDEKTDGASKELADKLHDALNKLAPPDYLHPDPHYMYQHARDFTIPSFHDIEASAQYRISNTPAGAARERIEELEKHAASEGIPAFPDWPVMIIWIEMAQDLSVILLFTVAILISPYLVHERRSGVRGLAYACRKGRPLFATQFGASLVIAALAEAVQFAVFIPLFLIGPHRVDLLFLGCDVSYERGLWWDMTFGQYMVWTSVIMFVLAFGFAMLSFAVSKLCKNYIAVLAAQIPLLFLAGKLSGRIIGTLFSVNRPPYFDPLVCAACVLLPLAVCLFLNHREKTADILS